MTGVVTAAAIGAGAALAGTGASLYSSSQASNRAGQAAGVAAQNQQAQAALQAEMMRQQRELQIATQTDVNGNKLIYDPQRGWVPLLSERGQQMLAAQNTAQDIEARKYFGRGQAEDEQAAMRRQAQGGEARKLLDEIKNRYGAPTQEGVAGENRVAGVTAATEPADFLKQGAAAAQLRTGGNAAGLSKGFEALDRSSAHGVRTALAAPQRGAFEDAFSGWRNNRLTPLQAHTAGATPPGQTPPTSGTDALSAQVAARAAKPMQVNPYTGFGQNQATAELLKAMGAQKDPDFGAAFTALGATGKELYKSIYDNNKKSTWQPGDANYPV